MAIGGKIKLEEGTAGGTYVGFKAPDTEVVNDLIWTLPDVDGTAGQVMVTDGNKNLSWSTAGGGDIGPETTARMNADSTITANLNSEVTSRLNSDSTLTANLNSEISARTAADSSLQANILTTVSIDHTFSSTLVSGTHYILDMRSASADLTLNWPAGAAKSKIRISVKPSSTYKIILDFNGTDTGFYAGIENATIDFPAGLEAWIEGSWDNTDSHWLIDDPTMPANGTLSGPFTITGPFTASGGFNNTLDETITFTNANGHGSASNNMVRKWSNKTGTPASMTYTSDSTNGDYVTINISGLYTIAYIDGGSGTTYFGLSRNASGSDLASNITNPWSLDYPGTKYLAGYAQGVSAGGNGAYVTWTGRLNATDVIRCQDNLDCNLSSRAYFRITKIG